MQPVSTARPFSPLSSGYSKIDATVTISDPREGGGIQGVIGDLIRSSAAGYQAATRQTGVQAEKAGIYPFESVITATSLLKQKTAGIKGVGKATSLLNTAAGFGMLILTSNLASTLKAPGGTATDLANRVADAIDGRHTAQGWSAGWGIRTGDDERAAGSVPTQPVVESSIGSALGSLGMK